MRLGLFRSLAFKLFAWVTLGNVVVLGLAVHLFNERTTRHFDEYLRRDFEQELVALASDLGQWYAVQGSFDLLQDNPWMWERWLGRNLFSVRKLPMDGDETAAQSSSPSHASRDGHTVATLPGTVAGEGGAETDDEDNIRSYPVSLLDSNGQLVVGSLPTHITRSMPVSLNGQLVGMLLVGDPPIAQNGLGAIELHFEQQYRWALLFFAGSLLLSTLLFSAWASWRIGLTLRRFGSALHELARGNHEVKLPQRGQDDLARLAGDIAQLGRTLADNEASQQRWLADIAHELRTPLAVLRGELEALRDGVRQPDDAAFRSLLAETARLERLVQDLRQLALLDRGEMQLQRQPCDLGELLADCLARHRTLLERHGLVLEAQLEREVWLNLDEDRVTQCLDNLATNTRRFTEAPGTLRVSLSRARSADGKSSHAVLVWEDSAPGVPATDLPHLGERLFRPDVSRSRATGGSGLGLSIAVGIAHAHGWRMQASSSALGGLCWTLTTDAIIAPPPEPSTGQYPNASLNVSPSTKDSTKPPRR